MGIISPFFAPLNQRLHRPHRWVGSIPFWILNWRIVRWVPVSGETFPIALPTGFDANGLPLAVQLVGRPTAEGTLIALAAQLEAAYPWQQHRPNFADS